MRSPLHAALLMQIDRQMPILERQVWEVQGGTTNRLNRINRLTELLLLCQAKGSASVKAELRGDDRLQAILFSESS
jgi:hypothetical protein